MEKRKADISDSPCLAGVLRLVALRRAAHATYDIPWAMRPAWVWTLVEANAGLVCASAPALRVLFKRTPAPSRSSAADEEGAPGAVRTIGSESTAPGMREVGRGVAELELKGVAEWEERRGEGGGSTTPTESMRSEEERELDERRLVWWGWKGQEF